MTWTPKPEKARQIYLGFLQRYPDHPLAELIREILAKGELVITLPTGPDEDPRTR